MRTNLPVRLSLVLAVLLAQPWVLAPPQNAALAGLARQNLLGFRPGRVLGGLAAREVTDEVGRHVRLPERIERVISLAPNLTEIVFALGAGDRLVGDTDYCDYPASARSRPHVGSLLSPSVERIVSLKPDLVLATVAGNRAETVTTLEKLGVPVYATNPRNVEGILTSILHIGELLGEDQAALRITSDVRQRLEKLQQRLEASLPQPSGSLPRVLFVVWEEPLISAGRNNFLTDAIAMAGGESITAGFSAEWPHISLEAAVHEQPDFLIFAYHGTSVEKSAELSERLARLKDRPGWREFRAVRQGKVILVSDTINRPAPRFFDAVEELARTLHPFLVSIHGKPEAF